MTIDDGRLVAPAGLDDLLSEEAVNDPVRYFAQMRDVNPVVWNPRWSGWIVTGYDEVIGGYRNHEQLSSERFVGPFAEELRTKASAYEQLLTFLSAFFVWKDPPYHTHIRTLVNKAFTPRAVEAFRPRVRQLVRELADPLEGRDDVNFFSEFSFTLPVIVIAEFLGVPAEARDDLADLVGGPRRRDLRQRRRRRAAPKGRGGDAQPRRAASPDRAGSAHRPAGRPHLGHGPGRGARRFPLGGRGDRQRDPDGLRRARDDDEPDLQRHRRVRPFPDQWQRLHDAPELSRSTVEEVMRYDGPIKAMARFAKEPMMIGEQKIATNDRVMLAMYAANHDPKQFGNPEQFDIGRAPNRHAGFGYGIHMCLGAPLARLEASEAFAYLTERYSRLEVRTPKLRYNPNMVSRSLTGLRVAVHPR